MNKWWNSVLLFISLFIMYYFFNEERGILEALFLSGFVATFHLLTFDWTNRLIKKVVTKVVKKVVK